MHGLCLKFITLSCQLTFCQPSFPASVPIPPEKQKTPWNLWLCSTYTWPKRGTYQRGLLPKSYHTGPGSIWDIYVGYQTNWVEKSHFWFFPLHFHHFKEAKPRQKRSLLRSLRTNFSKLHQEIKLRCVAWHVKAKRNSARNQCLATSHDRGLGRTVDFWHPKKPAEACNTTVSHDIYQENGPQEDVVDFRHAKVRIFLSSSLKGLAYTSYTLPIGMKTLKNDCK